MATTTDDPKTWPTCAFHDGPIAPFWISRKPVHAVGRLLWACDECIQERRYEATQARSEAPTERQEGFDFFEAVEV